MSITSALNAALTGLSATQRQAEITASNVANATTPAYARREVQLGAAVLAGTGQGVMVMGITRQVDQYVLAERRLAQAGDGDRALRSEFLGKVEASIGSPDQPGSIGARIAAFDRSLIEAASRPESEARLAVVANSARSLASGLAAASQDVQQARGTADRMIARDVDALNAGLAQVQDINATLRSFSGVGRDISALLDQRQRVIDQISAIVPLREVPREGNQIALFTTGGVSLLEGTPARFGFTASNTVTAEMTLAAGGLSGLTVNGRSVDTAGTSSPVLGGRLGALFAVRDDLAVTAQSGLDAMARDLVERFGTPAVDPTLAPGDPGLFTDQGAAFLPVNEAGLAARIRMNTAADPSQGGALFRLRDGLQATVPGALGSNTLLKNLHLALSAPRVLSSAGFAAGNRDMAGLAADVLSDASTRRLNADSEASFASARFATLSDLEKQGGVDTDQEMQMLLVIEKNYAANAKVIQTVSNMIDTLMRLGT